MKQSVDWKLVPVEWLDEQYSAMAEAYDKWSDDESVKNYLFCKPMYDAAIAAAPEHCGVVCRASQVDGIICPHDSCDIEDGVREPVAVVENDFMTVSVVIRTKRDEKLGQGTKLYTHPQSDKLRKAAEELHSFLGELKPNMHNWLSENRYMRLMHNLTTALEEK